MKYLALLVFLIGCNYTPENLEDKCFRPFAYSGAAIKVIECTNLPFYTIESNYCIVRVQNRFDYRLVRDDTIFVSRLERSIETNCPLGL